MILVDPCSAKGPNTISSPILALRFPMPSAPEFRAFGYLGDADQGETQVLDPSQDAVEVGLVDCPPISSCSCLA